MSVIVYVKYVCVSQRRQKKEIMDQEKKSRDQTKEPNEPQKGHRPS